MFNRLNRSDMDSIVDIQMIYVESMLKEQNIMLELDSSARAWLANKGYDPAYGARPLKRVIQRALQDPLAELLLSGEVLDGQTVHVGAGDEGLIVGNRVGRAGPKLGAVGEGPKPDATLH